MGCAGSTDADDGGDFDPGIPIGETRKFSDALTTSELGVCERCVYGSANLATKKNQDRHAVLTSQGADGSGALFHTFGVYDGHGPVAIGERAAIVAANELLPYAAANSSSAVAPETLYEAFEHTHETIQHNHGGEPTGTTATVVALNVDKNAAGESGVSVTCCWVGDSRAIIVTPDKRVWELSTDHNLGNEREQSRIEMESSRNALESGGYRSTFIVRRTDRHGNVGPTALFKIDPEAHKDRHLGDDAMQEMLDGKIEAQIGSGVNDISEEDRLAGVSHLVTRALGDPHGARSLSHMPELVGIPNVATGTRIILASDGVWDVLTNEKCAKLIMGVSDVQKAAHKLVTQAKNLRLKNLMRPDDLTAIVVDITPPIGASEKQVGALGHLAPTQIQLEMPEEGAQATKRGLGQRQDTENWNPDS